LLSVLGVVILLVVFALPPLLGGFFRGLAQDNPDWLRLPFVADAVREELGDRLERPAGRDDTPLEFVIAPNTSARQITDDLVERGVVTDSLAFSYILITEGAGSRLKAGTHSLSRSMTPREVANTLSRQPATSTRITVALRDGLRIEQVTAYLLTIEQLQFEPAEFFALASQPPADLVDDYPMLATLPAGRSVEGFLSFGVFEVERDVDAEGFLRKLLERRQAEIGDLVEVPPPPGLSDFYEVVTVASIVEAEAGVDEERAILAGVYLNRLDRSKWPSLLLNADPTVVYGNDTVVLRDMEIDDWVNYVFWAPPGRPMAEIPLRDDLGGYQTYLRRGIPPGPIRSPSRASIEAVLQPDMADGYLYFVAKGDGSRTHAFARTFDEHVANIRRYQGGTQAPPPASP
ncbi:MAG TPA: endolytic transglycosylase MltG, partial [Candidatus Caenarcaniphilales bacterium]|nr:endolytic transglycosylase MltG [Candidatus Caenarcaniphilales bacterium]